VTDGEATSFPIRYVELEAGRFRLRPPEPKDAVAALAMLTEAEVARWNPASDVTDLDTARSWLARGADWSTGGHRTWSIVNGDDAFVGNLSLWDLDYEHRSAGIGYRVAPQHRRQGIAGESVRVASRWAVEELGVERIALVHVVENAGSCGVARRAGYVLEGMLREEYRTSDGTRWDSHLHSLIRSDLAG
jgi:RimJ/RimL family protein N-acetyltransferase